MLSTRISSTLQIITGIVASIFLAFFSCMPVLILIFSCILVRCSTYPISTSLLTIALTIPLFIFIAFSAGFAISLKDKKPIFTKTLFVASCIVTFIYIFFIAMTYNEIRWLE